MQCVEVSGRLLHDVDDVLCVWWLLCRIDNYIIYHDIIQQVWILTYLSIYHHTCTQSWKCTMIKMELKSVQVSTILIYFAYTICTAIVWIHLRILHSRDGPESEMFFFSDVSKAMIQVVDPPHVGSSRDPLLKAKTFCEDYNLQFVEAHFCFSKHGNWDLELASNSNAKLLFSYKTSNCWLLLCVGMDFPIFSCPVFQKVQETPGCDVLCKPYTKQPTRSADSGAWKRWWGLYLIRWVLS